jgi:hypothetical protein
MKHKLGMLLLGSAVMAGPAAAQNAASLLQAADKAIGAGAVNSVVYSGTGWMGAVGQSFATEGAGSDWPPNGLQELCRDHRLPQQIL